MTALAPLISFFVSAAFTEIVALQLFIWRFAVESDPSSGDSAAWGFIVFQPVIAPAALIIGYIVSVRISRVLARRKQAQSRPT